MSRADAAFVLLIMVTLGVFLTMALGTMARVQQMAGGLRPFDMRPSGYTPDEANAFLEALGAPGRNYYRLRHLPLDLVFLLLLAAALIWSFLRLAPRWLAVALIAVALAGAAFDYLENSGIGRMLALYPHRLDPAEIVRISFWTHAKSAMVSVPMVALAGLVMWKGRQRWQAGS